MASRSRPPFTNFDPETEEKARRQGRDPYELDLAMEQFMSVIYANLPDPAVHTDAHLAASLSTSSDGIDRISGLPEGLLGDIVSRLPAKDAARTAVLATRWRGVWRSAPLLLVDAHLSSGAWPPTDNPSVVAAVSRVLAAHPGPFRCVHLVYSRMAERQAELRHWLSLLAAKIGRASCRERV